MLDAPSVYLPISTEREGDGKARGEEFKRREEGGVGLLPSAHLAREKPLQSRPSQRAGGRRRRRPAYLLCSGIGG